MCACLVPRVSLARNLVAIAGSVSSPCEKASLHALPTAPAPARIAALVVLEKVDDEAEVEKAFRDFVTLSVWASCAPVRKSDNFPSLNKLHLRARAAAAKLPWQPSGRGRRSSLGKSTTKENMLKARGEVL